MEFQTYEECVKRKSEFVDWDYSSVAEQERACCSGVSVRRGGFLFRWFLNGMYHRVDGPAVIDFIGRSWYWCGNNVDVGSQAEFEEWLAKNL